MAGSHAWTEQAGAVEPADPSGRPGAAATDGRFASCTLESQRYSQPLGLCRRRRTNWLIDAVLPTGTPSKSTSPDHDADSVSVIVPTYREAANVPTLIRRVKEVEARR